MHEGNLIEGLTGLVERAERQSNLPFHNPVEVALKSPIARTADPEPSHFAAGEVTRSGKREGQLLAVLALVRRFPLCTSLELSMRSALDRYVIARRLPELEKAHLVCRRIVRECTVGKRPATTWEAV